MELFGTGRITAGLFGLVVTLVVLFYGSTLRASLINQRYEQPIDNYEQALNSPQVLFDPTVDPTNPVSHFLDINSKVFKHFSQVALYISLHIGWSRSSCVQ